MIINPIMPIWIMSIICIILILIILFFNDLKNKIIKNEFNNKKKSINVNSIIEIAIVVILFIINLRIMISNGKNTMLNMNLNVIFVIDTSYSMRALDYDGNKERIEGVKNDCCYIIDELSGSKFSIITFGDEARKLMPFTTDSDLVQSEIKAIQLEEELYAKGTSINLVKDFLEKTLKVEMEKQEKGTKFIIFLITDGEITKEEEILDSFKNIRQYISNGAVLGYGTLEGGKMKNSYFSIDPDSEYGYVHYYDNYEMKTALSKLDEGNLNQIAKDLGIDYIHMDSTNKINSKINDIKNNSLKSQSLEEKANYYQDIYYYFSIPLVILLIIKFIIQKRRM